MALPKLARVMDTAFDCYCSTRDLLSEPNEFPDFFSSLERSVSWPPSDFFLLNLLCPDMKLLPVIRIFFSISFNSSRILGSSFSPFASASTYIWATFFCSSVTLVLLLLSELEDDIEANMAKEVR